MMDDPPPAYEPPSYDAAIREQPPPSYIAATVVSHRGARPRSMSWAAPSDADVVACSAVAIDTESGGGASTESVAALQAPPRSSNAVATAVTAATATVSAVASASALAVLVSFADVLDEQLSATVARRKSDLDRCGLGDFTLGAEPIGVGSNCVCWEATSTAGDLGRVGAGASFALKRARLYSHNNVRSRFVRELETSHACAHPNVTSIYSVFSAPPHEPDRPEALILAEAAAAPSAADAPLSPSSTVSVRAQYSVMELLRGGNLEEYIVARGAMPERQCLYVALQIFDALDCLHRGGVAHCDLKADNVAFRNEWANTGGSGGAFAGAGAAGCGGDTASGGRGSSSSGGGGGSASGLGGGGADGCDASCAEESADRSSVPIVSLVDFGEATPPTGSRGGGVLQRASFSGSRPTMPPGMFAAAPSSETAHASDAGDGGDGGGDDGSDGGDCGDARSEVKLHDWRCADIWALGLVLHGLCSGPGAPAPFTSEDVESGAVPPMPPLPAGYERLEIVARECLAAEPARRPTARRAARLCASALWELPVTDEGEVEDPVALAGMADALAAHFTAAGFWSDMVEAHTRDEELAQLTRASRSSARSPRWDFVACGGEEIRLQLRYLRAAMAVAEAKRRVGGATTAASATVVM